MSASTQPPGGGTSVVDPDIAARMDRLPITPLHRRVTVVIGLGQLFDLYELFLAGVLSTVLVGRFHLDKAVLPLLLSSGFAGMFVGAITLGRMADRFGRRTTFLLSLVLYSVFSLLSAFSPGPAMLVVTRFLAGIGIGAEPPVADTYLGDVLPPRQRGRYTALAYTVGFLGVPAAGFLARGLVPHSPLGVEGWRWMFVIGALGALVVAVLRSSLPESPRWLASVGRTAEADEIVRRFEAQAGVDHHPAPPDAGSGPTAAEPVTTTVGDLLRPPFRRRTLMMTVFHLLQTFGYYGFGTLVPIVLAAKGFPVVSSLLFVALTFIGYPVGSALSLPLIERFERKFLLIGAGLGMAVFGLAFGLSTSAGAIVAFGFLYTVISNVFSNAFHVYQAEFFPTGVRATAASWTFALSRLGSAALPFILLPALDAGGPVALFSVISVAMVLLAINVGVFGPRTTGLQLEAVNTAA